MKKFWEELKLFWKQEFKCSHDWKLVAQGENMNKGIRYGIYDCKLCGKKTYPFDKERELQGLLKKSHYFLYQLLTLL